jgi:hypothetical protein
MLSVGNVEVDMFGCCLKFIFLNTELLANAKLVVFSIYFLVDMILMWETLFIAQNHGQNLVKLMLAMGMLAGVKPWHTTITMASKFSCYVH